MIDRLTLIQSHNPEVFFSKAHAPVTVTHCARKICKYHMKDTTGTLLSIY